MHKDFEWMKNKSLKIISALSLFLLLFLSVTATAQKENIITGRVFPAGMETPMRDVKVHVEGNDSLFIMTDNAGRFSIEVKSFPVNLVFSKATYHTQIKKVKKPIEVSVYMLAGGKK